MTKRTTLPLAGSSLIAVLFCFIAPAVFAATYTYTYDGLSRLQTVTVHYASYTITEQYALDPGGNRSSLTITTNSGQPPAPTEPTLSASAVIRGQTITVTGDIPDPAGTTAAVQVSMDGGATWHTASWYRINNVTHWSYAWNPQLSGSHTIDVWVTDTSGNVGTTSTTVVVTVGNPVLLVRTAVTYPTLQEAYSNAQAGDTIKACAVTMAEDVTLNRSVNSITIDGGYNSNFSSNTGGMTNLKGMMDVEHGTVTIKNFNLTDQ